MGAALLPLMIASTAFSVIGSLQQGIAGKAAGDYNAEVARQNAIHAERAGQARAMNVGLKSAAEGGRIKAAQAANNVNVNTGSAVEVQKGQRMAGAADQTNTTNDALVQAYGYKAQEGIEKYKGNAAMAQGVVGALGAATGGAAKIAGGDFFGSSSGSSTGQALQSSAGSYQYTGPDTAGSYA